MSLSDKRILFISQTAHYFHTEIVNSLIRQGCKVTFYPEMIYSLFYRFSNKISLRLKIYLEKKYINKIIENIGRDSYDFVFIINGATLSKPSLEYLHEKLPKAIFIMYQWDSIRQNNYKSIIEYFDYVHTFDMCDAKQYNLIYTPLFYVDRYAEVAKNKKDIEYNLVFFGAYHSDRLEIIKQIAKLLEQNKLIFRHHLYVSKLSLLRLVITGEISIRDIDFFKTHPVSLDDIVDSYTRSDAVLDIELPIQNGLTIRTFEALGAGLKVVTTNKNIISESFYDPYRIMVIDRQNINIDMNFFVYKNEESNMYKQFHIDRWLHNIFSYKSS